VSIAANSTAGTVIASVSVRMSDGSAFTGSITISYAGSANYLTTSSAVPVLTTPPGTALYSITQPIGPAYVSALSPRNLLWWQLTSATVTPFTGTLPTPRLGAALYHITQPEPGAPSYIGDLTAADVAWWLGTGSTVVPYTAPTGLPLGVTTYLVLSRNLATVDPGAAFSVAATEAGQTGSATETITISPATALYFITQPIGPTYVGDLTPANLAYWQGLTGITVTPYAGTLPTPRPGASLYQIIQPGAASDPTVPGYVGDLTAADVAWWQSTGSTVTPYDPVSALAPPSA
jgi:hypothetical protein